MGSVFSSQDYVPLVKDNRIRVLPELTLITLGTGRLFFKLKIARERRIDFFTSSFPRNSHARDVSSWDLRSSDFFYPCFGQIMHSIRTGEPARTLLSSSDGFELLRRDPELARIFDDAMTNASELVCPRDCGRV